MADKFMHLVLTPAVQRAQEKYFGGYEEVSGAFEADRLTSDELSFIAARDSFYLATVSETGWPYVQHRGGEKGFLKVLAPGLIGFADYRGNRQLLTTGNLSANDRVSLFLMDYPGRRRLKLLGHARVLDAREHPEMVEQFVSGERPPRVERIFLIQVVGYDWNCPQYITPRYTAAELEQYAAALQRRITGLEKKLAALDAATARANAASRPPADARGTGAADPDGNSPVRSRGSDIFHENHACSPGPSSPRRVRDRRTSGTFR